ncbi:methyltransferase domain-containing protein [Candidatus Pseudothioglobus singularis]|nr:methyltransferase domain-containing protein [Candidatus Pseudothioglobus singularis]
MKLNIGCGNKRVNGYLGVDKNRCEAADYICDIENEKLPFEDNTIEAIILDNVIEHFYDIPKVINELVRVSKSGTVITIITPHFSSLTSWIDPTHIHHLSYFSFDHFEKTSNPQNYMEQMIRIKHKKLSFGGGVLGLTARLIFKLSPKKYEKKYCFIFRASTLTFDIEVL